MIHEPVLARVLDPVHHKQFLCIPGHIVCFLASSASCIPRALPYLQTTSQIWLVLILNRVKKTLFGRMNVS